jgi:RHS repeat-associated protein
MPQTFTKEAENKERTSGNQAIQAPAVTFPKAGGAIRSIGEKFAANPVTGTGSMRVSIATSHVRGGVEPQLSVSYDSGAGNGPFGVGWNLALLSIMRGTDKGLPKYRDADESDVFILPGAEDLVPVLQRDAKGKWVPEELPPRNVNGVEYRIRRYRPRVEGLFARIERWTNTANGDTHWRSISKENITTLYGRTAESRIADPSDPSRIFSWLICESYDDKGNITSYRYKEEDSAGINLAQAHERNRTPQSRSANRYLKRIHYGNGTSLLANGHSISPLGPDLSAMKWLFEVVFDYGEHDETNPHRSDDATDPSTKSKPWPVRNDPFSSYRAGFEVRTYRLCQRVLMFHHISNQPDGQPGYDGLVRSTDFTYSSEKNPTDTRNPIFSFLTSAGQTGYKRQPSGGYRKKSLPPVEFKYSEATIQPEIREVEPASLENLPIGLDGTAYQWIDLHGEGIPGIVTEQAGAWFYKRNLSPINLVGLNGSARLEARFAPVELVAIRPNLALAGGAQFMDLAGNGQSDFVMLDGPMPGLYEHDEEEGWKPFRLFTSRLNRNTGHRNFIFIDLDGDGRADILISEDEVFCWHPSLAKDGFGAAEFVRKPFDEEKGARSVYADHIQSIHLADMSGDGLTDLVRIRNGEVCYWPNLGYGRFGAMVTMDYSPSDRPDKFDQKRIRLADVDGSGLTDIIYLHEDGVRIYFNQSGNSWSQPPTVPAFPRIDNQTAVAVVDLLGNGTSCLVWSSSLPGDVGRQMRYIDLMGSQNPRLLISTKDNLGMETHVEYAPSTKFYSQDKQAGKPWITKLPFPVHCVEKVTVKDRLRDTEFSTTYSYHHGHFDGTEREFRGFGCVVHLDAGSYGKFAQGNSASSYITDDKTLYQPPVKTVTWYHTGAFLDRERILHQFAHEYFEKGALERDFDEKVLPEPDLDTEDLTAEEWREALRACKGMMLRQEVYELDVHALELGEHRPVKLFTTAYHNCHIRRLQPQADNRHAVFLVAESEALTYHYELDLTSPNVVPDPRVAHTLNLQFDEYANVLQSVAVTYPRLGKFGDATLSNDALNLIDGVQKELHLAYTETRYTNDIVPVKENDVWQNLDVHRLPVPCEVLTYELRGISPAEKLDLTETEKRYFTLDELRRFRLSTFHQSSGEDVTGLAYHEVAKGETSEQRLVEHVRILFFAEDLKNPLPFREQGRLGLLFKTYKLALTDDLLNAVFGAKLDTVVHAKLSDAAASGYLSGTPLTERFGPDTTGQYWISSGIAGFAPDATEHFYLPERYSDPFGNVTNVAFDHLDLYLQSSTDALGNVTSITTFDFRVLAPSKMRDINNNLSEVFFDVLGLPVASAVKGKANEGDELSSFADDLANPALDELQAFFTEEKPFDEAQARNWLGNATARHVYYFGEIQNQDGSITWGVNPSCSCGILREHHLSQLAPNAQSPIQAAFDYTDGLGAVVVKKVQAEPETKGGPLRWIANGRTILNNKGKPVKQYEPSFSSSGHRFEPPNEYGVTPVMYYDAPGRLIRTELPNGSFSRIEFSPWHVHSFDPNDTAFDPVNGKHSDWYQRRTDPAHPRFQEFENPANKRAAKLIEAHANTPSITILDSLGRDVISVVRNWVKDAADGLQDEKYLTFTKLDAEGKPLWIRDARQNLVMQYITPPVPDNEPTDPADGFTPCYDIAGNLLFQHSLDAGDCWMLNDAAGKQMLAWNSRGYLVRTEYDALHRPIRSFVQRGDPDDSHSESFAKEIMVGRTIYGEQHPEAEVRNLRGRAFMQFDQAGVVTNRGHDFKGNLLRSSRRLAREYRAVADWSPLESVPGMKTTSVPPAPLDLSTLNNQLSTFLENETFTGSSSFDALNRPIQMVAPHSDQPGVRFNVIRPAYNEANLLERVDLWLQQTNEPAALLSPTTATQHIVENIDYNARGQRILIQYGNSAETRYQYDPETFSLIHLYTRRGSSFTNDCDNPEPPPPTIAAPQMPPGNKPCGLQNLHYTYDPVGNITGIRDGAQQTIFFNGAVVVPSNEYEYDPLYRLIGAMGREHIGQTTSPQVDEDDSPRMNQPLPTDAQAMRNYTEEYNYDSVGNILTMIHFAGPNGSWTRRYDCEATNNRLRATSLPGDGDGVFSAKYAYDPHGNMVKMPHLSLMQWDYRDQLQATTKQVNNSGPTEKTWYVYDAAGQRVRKITDNANESKKNQRIYLGGFEIYREHKGGASPELERETLHVMDDKQRIAVVEVKIRDSGSQISNPESLIRYQLGNHLGSGCLELGGQAQIISYEEYYPYGSTSYQAVDESIRATAKRYRYTGKERDEENGLYYYGARYYASWLGRWALCDPLGIRDGLVMYAYVANNPIRMIDPDGKEKTDSDRIWGVVSILVPIVGIARGAKAVFSGQVSTDYLIPGIGAVAGVVDNSYEAYKSGKETISNVRAGKGLDALRSGVDTGLALTGALKSGGALVAETAPLVNSGTAKTPTVSPGADDGSGISVRVVSEGPARPLVETPELPPAQPPAAPRQPKQLPPGPPLPKQLTAEPDASVRAHDNAGARATSVLTTGGPNKGKKAVAAVDVNVPGYNRDPVVRARSGLKTPAGYQQTVTHAPVPKQRTLSTYKVQNALGEHSGSRLHDAEVRGLEYVQPGLPPNAQGTVDFASNQPLCPSCTTAVFEFQANNPGLDVGVHAPVRPVPRLPIKPGPF